MTDIKDNAPLESDALNTEELFEVALTYADNGRLGDALDALIELEKRKIVTLYAGSYSFEMAKEHVGEYADASFYFYRRKNKKGYHLYVNPLGVGIREDSGIFDREHKTQYSKKKLCGNGADTREGEYFKHGARSFLGELFSELLAELIVSGIFLALGLGVMLLFDVSHDNLDSDTVILFGIGAFVVIVILISITVSALKRKERLNNTTINDDFDKSTVNNSDTRENAIWSGDVAEKSKKSYSFTTEMSRRELNEALTKNAELRRMKHLITESGFKLMVKTTHGGKYVYDARVTEREGGSDISGELWFVFWDNGKKSTVMSKIGNAVLCVMMAILLVLLAIPLGIYYLIRKIFKLNDDDSDSPKNRLISFMTDEINADYSEESAEK